MAQSRTVRIDSSTTNSLASILAYRNDLVRTGKTLPLGRTKQIAIAPAEGWAPPDNDPLIERYGRLMQFRDRTMPIAQSEDRSQILCMAPMIGRDGYAGLEDIPLPDWKPRDPTKEEIEGVLKKDKKSGREWREAAPIDPKRFAPPMIPQRLRDRAQGKVEGTDFLIFSPVLSVAFQPELGNAMIGTVWVLVWEYNAADNTHPTMLVHERTGETHFFGGRYDIQRPRGEE